MGWLSSLEACFCAKVMRTIFKASSYWLKRLWPEHAAWILVQSENEGPTAAWLNESCLVHGGTGSPNISQPAHWNLSVLEPWASNGDTNMNEVSLRSDRLWRRDEKVECTVTPLYSALRNCEREDVHDGKGLKMAKDIVFIRFSMDIPRVYLHVWFFSNTTGKLPSNFVELFSMVSHLHHAQRRSASPFSEAKPNSECFVLQKHPAVGCCKICKNYWVDCKMIRVTTSVPSISKSTRLIVQPDTFKVLQVHCSPGSCLYVFVFCLADVFRQFQSWSILGLRGVIWARKQINRFHNFRWWSARCHVPSFLSILNSICHVRFVAKIANLDTSSTQAAVSMLRTFKPYSLVVLLRLQ